MKRFRALIVLLLFSAFSSIFSQELSHQVLVPVAGISSLSNIEYTHTIGEAVVDIIGIYDIVLTQGFQQPRILLNDTADNRGNGVKVFPNPVDEDLYIDLFGEGPRTFSIEIINLQGIIRISDKVSYSGIFFDRLKYDAGGLSRGLYIVRVVSGDGLISRIFKIQKL